MEKPAIEEGAKRVEEVKPKVKVEEPEADATSDAEASRAGPSSRKKFPTLKASPRTKDDTPPVLKRRAERPIVPTRPKRALRENSMDEGRTSGEESVKTSIGSEEQVTYLVLREEEEIFLCLQRSSSRVRSREESLKQSKKEARAGKLSSKSSDSDGSKKGKSDEPKKMEWSKAKRSLDDSGPKKNRKVKAVEKDAIDPSKAKPCIPRNRCVLKGDVVKVYYGSPNENVIYEAKVQVMNSKYIF